MLKLMKQLKPYRMWVALIVLLVFVRTLTELLLPTFMAEIIDVGVRNGDTAFILSTGGTMLVIALVGGGVTVLNSYLSSRVGVGFAKDIREKVFKKVTSYSLSEVDEFGTASLITRSTNDVTQVQNVVVMFLRFFMRAPLMAVGSIFMAWRMDVPLTMIILGVVVVMGVTIALVASRAIPLFNVVQKKVDQLNLVLRERLTGMRVIRAFNKIDYENKRFNKANEELTDVSIRVNKLMAVVHPLMMLFFNVTSITLVWFGAIRVDVGAIQVGNLLALIQYGMQIMFAVLMLTMVFIMVPRAQASAVRINEVLEKDPEIVDPKNAKGIFTEGATVEFRNVTFAYHSDHGAKEAAIKNLSFKSGPGQVTAIIGGTGSGKSTLVNLIPRFYDVDKGEVLVGGVNVKDVSMKDLRSKIGLVPQKALLFSGSANDNVAFGMTETNEEQVVKALEIAQGYDFVMEKENGLEMTIAQGGNNVSGGQKQRLSIARAIAKEPEIYLFDDSFSALDFKTEAMLREALRKETSNATVLVVAQRVTTVMDADQIIVLDDGEPVGIGTHEELLRTNNVYKEIVLSQLSEEEIA